MSFKGRTYDSKKPQAFKDTTTNAWNIPSTEEAMRLRHRCKILEQALMHIKDFALCITTDNDTTSKLNIDEIIQMVEWGLAGKNVEEELTNNIFQTNEQVHSGD